MHVQAESRGEHLLHLRRIHRFAGGGTEEPEALHVIGGELRGQERVGMARDQREERSGEDDEQHGHGEWNEAAEPGGTGSG